VLVLLVTWGFGRVIQWLVSDTERFQALYLQATDWLDEHGIPAKTLMAAGYNPSWITSVMREIGGRGSRLISFIVIAFAFTVLGLLEVDTASRNVNIDAHGKRGCSGRPQTR
jgi:AI-2 transport protein TqsA